MKNTISKVVLIIGLAVGILTLSMADIPKQINIQGQLTDPTGVPLNGVYTCTFSLYSLPTGGNYFYQESFSYLTVQNGIFNYSLGSNGSLGLVFGTTYWLGITIGTDPEMSPRTPIVSVGNAYKALNSDSSGTAGTLPDGGGITGGVINISRLSPDVAFRNQSNTWTGTSNTFITPVSFSTIQNISGGPLNISSDSTLNVKFPTCNYVVFGLNTAGGNNEVFIGSDYPGNKRPFLNSPWSYTGCLNLLGPDISSNPLAARMRLFSLGSTGGGIIETDSNGGSIKLYPSDMALLKGSNAGDLPVGTMEVFNSGAMYSFLRNTGTFGSCSVLGGYVNFSTAGYRSLTNTNYDVQLQPYLASVSAPTTGYVTVVYNKTVDYFYYKVFQTNNNADVTATIPISWRVYYYQ